VIDLVLAYANPVWTLYVLSVIVIVGAIVNAVLGKHFDHTLRAAMRHRPVETRDGKRVVVSTYQ
jgi:hypothetical protein